MTRNPDLLKDTEMVKAYEEWDRAMVVVNVQKERLKYAKEDLDRATANVIRLGRGSRHDRHE